MEKHDVWEYFNLIDTIKRKLLKKIEFIEAICREDGSITIALEDEKRSI